MNESLRQDYLNAMGITQYVARIPLPGACPSPVMDTSHVMEMGASDYKTESTVSVVSLLGDDFAAVKKSPTPSSPSPLPAVDTPSVNTPPTTTTFQCQIAIWTVNDLLVLADAPRLDNHQLTLLRNILQAIGRKDHLPDTRQFVWPLPQRKDKSLLAAQEHFQGLLDGGLLKTNGLRQIVCFGTNVCVLLQNTPDAPEKNLQQYQDWPVTAVCALHEMLSQPARKADTWRTLQVLLQN